jgi:hypothetical protein
MRRHRKKETERKDRGKETKGRQMVETDLI